MFSFVRYGAMEPLSQVDFRFVLSGLWGHRYGRATRSGGGTHRGRYSEFPVPFRHCRLRAKRSGGRSPTKRAGAVRFLCAGAVLVAVLLRSRARTRARPGARSAMRRAAVFLCGAWAMAAIRARLPGL